MKRSTEFLYALRYENNSLVKLLTYSDVNTVRCPELDQEMIKGLDIIVPWYKTPKIVVVAKVYTPRAGTVPIHLLD